MAKHLKPLLLLSFLTVLALRADIRGCECLASNPQEMAERMCALCAAADRTPAYMTVFFLKDANPTKPNRILALPRVHGPGEHLLSSLPPELRKTLWSAAIARAQELWGDDWAIACNSPERRTQCHTHLHIGKLLPEGENASFTIADGPEAIPAPLDTGILVHAVAGKLHCHLESAPELSLAR